MHRNVLWQAAEEHDIVSVLKKFERLKVTPLCMWDQGRGATLGSVNYSDA